MGGTPSTPRAPGTPVATTHLDAFLAASAKFAEGAAPNRLFNGLHAKQGTGFKHVDVFELPAGAVLPFEGRPPAARPDRGSYGGAVLALPHDSSELLRGIVNSLRSHSKYYLYGGAGIGKSALLSALAGRVYATRPGADIYCHEQDTA